MIVAALLAVITWFAVYRLVAERPHIAREGRAYLLIARSDCRYTSGQCSLENASFKSTLARIFAATETALQMPFNRNCLFIKFGNKMSDI